MSSGLSLPRLCPAKRMKPAPKKPLQHYKEIRGKSPSSSHTRSYNLHCQLANAREAQPCYGSYIGVSREERHNSETR